MDKHFVLSQIDNITLPCEWHIVFGPLQNEGALMQGGDLRARDGSKPAMRDWANSKDERHDLTFKEKEVLLWVMQGKTCWEVGTILSVSERTIKFHLHNIYTKLNVVNRAQAVTMANKRGLI
jgi:LuxR family transcriptional regulator, quorum-sensing system regulator SolR